MPASNDGLFIINDSTNNDILHPKGFSKGYDPASVPADLPKPRQLFGDAPGQIKEMSDSEILARTQELWERKATLWHLRQTAANGQQMPTLDQNGQGYCTTEDSEVLTERGWVAWPNYNWTDPIATVNQQTHALEFQQPFEKHVYEYDGEMIYSTNRRIDFGVTPDHQMYVRKWDEAKRTLANDYSFVRAGDLGWYAGLMHAPSGQIGTELIELEVPGDRAYDGDDFFALLGLIVSDGYAGGTDNTKNWVSFASFREDMRSSIQMLAARVGFTECPSRKGIWIRYDAGALALWLRQNAYVGGMTGARAKRIPDIVKVASRRQIKHFLNWFDDRNRDGSQFYSTSKRLIDDLQELHLRIGKRCHIGLRQGKKTPYSGNASGFINSGDGYILTVGSDDRLCIDKKKHIETDRYKGLVYCAAVPNHTLLTRRNGSVLISSNCWAYSVTRGVMYMRALQNQPYRRLSAHAVGCMVKNYRDEGAWCGLSYKFIAERGVPSVEFWKEKSMSRSNDTPATWENAAANKIAEGYFDPGVAVYDQSLTKRQRQTLLCLCIPYAADRNRWSHSTIDHTPVIVDGEVWTMGDNSWTDGWGDVGCYTFVGNSMEHVDGAVAIRAVPASVN